MFELFRRALGLIGFIIMANILAVILNGLSYVVASILAVPMDILMNPLIMIVVQFAWFIVAIMILFKVFD